MVITDKAHFDTVMDECAARMDALTPYQLIETAERVKESWWDRTYVGQIKQVLRGEVEAVPEHCVMDILNHYHANWAMGRRFRETSTQPHRFRGMTVQDVVNWFCVADQYLYEDYQRVKDLPRADLERSLLRLMGHPDSNHERECWWAAGHECHCACKVMNTAVRKLVLAEALKSRRGESYEPHTPTTVSAFICELSGMETLLEDDLMATSPASWLNWTPTSVCGTTGTPWGPSTP